MLDADLGFQVQIYVYCGKGTLWFKLALEKHLLKRYFLGNRVFIYNTPSKTENKYSYVLRMLVLLYKNSVELKRSCWGSYHHLTQRDILKHIGVVSSCISCLCVFVVLPRVMCWLERYSIWDCTASRVCSVDNGTHWVKYLYVAKTNTAKGNKPFLKFLKIGKYTSNITNKTSGWISAYTGCCHSRCKLPVLPEMKYFVLCLPPDETTWNLTHTRTRCRHTRLVLTGF